MSLLVFHLGREMRSSSSFWVKDKAIAMRIFTFEMPTSNETLVVKGNSCHFAAFSLL